ncbi:hemerythrin domain-containing protein [Pendulispora brunnea]|uniref:Hemerythrin domain-containing protein n=1 Tax=Pendulispora brunnea TaxID=2905690 RepID=A0ABZ2K2A0_9BACT
MSHDPYVAHDIHLRRVHQALLARIRELGESGAPPGSAAPTDLPDRVIFACKALLFHHHAESTGLFPRLRRAGRLRSADIAFLDACDRDHVTIHVVTQRLLAEGEAPHPRPSEIATLAREIAAHFDPHAADEEAGLAPERLRAMIPAEELEAMAREASRPR